MVAARQRHSEYIGIKPAGSLLHAARIANAVASPLNVLVTLNLTCLGCPAVDASRRVALLRERYRKWVTRPRRCHLEHCSLPYFAWVLENPTHLNAHILFHVPPARLDDFRERVHGWVEGVIGGASDDETTNLRENVDYAPGVVEYMLKGAHPSAVSFYGLRAQHQGWVIGQRAGTSRSLGPMQKGRLRESGVYPRTRQRFQRV